MPDILLFNAVMFKNDINKCFRNFNLEWGVVGGGAGWNHGRGSIRDVFFSSYGQICKHFSVGFFLLYKPIALGSRDA